MQLTILKLGLAVVSIGLVPTSAPAQSVPGGYDLDLRSQVIDYCLSQPDVTIGTPDLLACINSKYRELWWAKYGPHNGPGGPQGPIDVGSPVCNRHIGGGGCDP